MILAAGSSSRLGSPKQLKVLNGETLLARTIKACSQSSAYKTFVVLGANEQMIAASVNLAHVTTLHNDQWQQGMGTSIRSAISTLEDTDADAAIFVSCDQPFIHAAILDELITKFESHHSIVASTYAGVVGIPALFPRNEFHALKTLAADEGARKILRDKSKQICTISFEAGKYDIDTENDWDEVCRLVETHGSNSRME